MGIPWRLKWLLLWFEKSIWPITVVPYFPHRKVNPELVPPKGPLIAAANHASFLDGWFLVHGFPRYPLRMLINDPWFRRSVLWKLFFQQQATLPVVAEDPVGTIVKVVRALERGDLIGIFPEGRISKDGKVQRGHLGFAWAAALSGVPVVPCGIWGNFEALPRTTRRPRRHPVENRYGPPRVFPGGKNPEPDPGAVRDFGALIMGDICRLAGQPERVDYAVPRLALDLRPALREKMRTNPDYKTSSRKALKNRNLHDR